MKILVVAQHQHDGSPTAIFIHDQIKEYVRAGHEVLVIAPVGIAKPDWIGDRFSLRTKACEIDGIPHVFPRYLTQSRFGAKHINTPSAVYAVKKQMRSLLNGFQPDIIHAHVLGLGSCVGAALKEALGCPLVVTTHGSDTVLPLERGDVALLRTFCDQADLVLAVSKQLKERLSTCGTKTQIRVIPNGYVPYPRPDAGKQPLSEMIQVGNLIPSKRVDVTIRAFAQLRREWPDMRLTVVGRGPLRAELEALCRELEVEEYVRFLGQIPDEEVFRRMCEAGFFVMVSKPEGFGIVYLEAMAAGCVTIGTEGEGIADLIVSGENGFLVPADDPAAIARVIDACRADPGRAQEIALRGKEAAQGLNWVNNAQQYVALFEELRNKK